MQRFESNRAQGVLFEADQGIEAERLNAAADWQQQEIARLRTYQPDGFETQLEAQERQLDLIRARGENQQADGPAAGEATQMQYELIGSQLGEVALSQQAA